MKNIYILSLVVCLLGLNEHLSAQIPIVWTDLVGVEVNGETIHKTVASSSNAGAVSVQSISVNGNGWVETTVDQTNVDRLFGFSNPAGNVVGESSVDYSIFLRYTGIIQINEAGVSKGQFGNYQNGDILRVERIDGTVYYKKNGVTFYTSTVTSTSELLVDAYFSNTGSRLYQTKIGNTRNGLAADNLEIQALKDFYNSTSGANWTDNTGWPSTEAEWSAITSVDQIVGWKGVTIGNGDITNISLSNNELSGALPSTLGNLNSLIYMYLYDNDLTGAIPATFGNLNSLERMYLYNNNLSGSIPSELGNLSALSLLYLNNNDLSGNIPSSLGSLSVLTGLSLGGNSLTGTIPAELGNLTNLTNLSLHANQLSGALPSALGNLNSLIYMYLYDNDLTGVIPATFGNLNSLERMYLYNNNLSGAIPSELGNLSALSLLYLYNNGLSGNIPSSLGSLSVLTGLSLGGNSFTGTIPAELGNLANLTNLSLHANQLSGALPSTLGNLNSLIYMYLYDNDLTGVIPATFGNLNSLERMYLYNNNLSGAIPSELGNLSALSLLYLYNNSLQSLPNWSSNNNISNWQVSLKNNRIPQSHIDANLNGDGTNNFATFTYDPQQASNGSVYDHIEIQALKDFYTSTNGASWTDNTGWPSTETEWDTVTNVSQVANWKGIVVENGDVTWLDLPGNNVVGTLPISLGTLAGLQRLYLSNAISGELPSSIGDLAQLQFIHLNDNQLSGVVPTSIGNLTQLQILALNSNQLSGQLPDELGDLAALTTLFLHNNLFSGTLPTTLGDLSNLQFFYIQGGTISGTIPASFANLSALKILFIYNCPMEGELPAFLGDLPELYYIYIAKTNMTGSIPDNWMNLAKLQYLYLFGNELITGNVPSALGNLTELKVIHLGKNSLTGSIPASLGSLTNLQYLYLHKNELTGNIPSSLGDLTSLKYLYIYENQLTGSLPSSLGNLNKVKSLHLYSNLLSDNIEVDFTGLTLLDGLYFQNNNFTSFPNLVGHPNAVNLTINLQSNNISYADVEANLNGDGTHSFKTFTYQDQANNSPTAPTEVVVEGTQLIIDTHDASVNNTYLWEKLEADGSTWADITATNENATGDKFVKTTTATESGTYRYTITNSLINQTKTSEPIQISTIHPNQVFLDQWAFQYTYDHRQRMVEKQVPGAGVVYMVYDDRDRLVLTQDANQRADNQWIFTKYDVLNRPVMTGIYTDVNYTTREGMQDFVNSKVGMPSKAAWYESPGTAIHGYDNLAFPTVVSEQDYLTVTYYDNYAWNTDANYQYAKPSESCITTNDTLLL